MNGFTLVILLDWASILFGFLAAGLWLKSTRTRISPDPNSNDYQIIESDDGKEYEVLETIKRQAVWSHRAAFATALAVLGQAVSMLLEATS